MIGSYNFTSSMNTIRAGMYFNVPQARLPASGWETDLDQLRLAYSLQAKGTGPTDFYGMVNNAINSFWPAPFRPGIDKPRFDDERKTKEEEKSAFF